MIEFYSYLLLRPVSHISAQRAMLEKTGIKLTNMEQAPR